MYINQIIKMYNHPWSGMKSTELEVDAISAHTQSLSTPRKTKSLQKFEF